MKRLTLLRHAKSGWDDRVLRDFDRPLNPRGRRAARTIGAEMGAQGLSFDRVIASPAMRVIETLNDVAKGYRGPLEPLYDQRIYLAAAATLLDIIREVPDSVSRLLLVGHNPGLEMLALSLASQSPLRDELAVKYPTATLAEIAIPVSSWREVGEGQGSLARFVRPRDLDPELGPDDEGH
jgi:phosphohistidine phosphatase